MWYMHEGIGWWMAFGGIWMIAFWGGLIALIIWDIIKLSKPGSSSLKNDPLILAKERYARGEITQKEFDELKKNLA